MIFRFSDPVYGGTIDYVYDTLGVTHSYTMELRPPANFSGKGFILPACQITESGREIMAAFKALITPLMAETVRKVKRRRKLTSQ